MLTNLDLLEWGPQDTPSTYGLGSDPFSWSQSSTWGQQAQTHNPGSPQITSAVLLRAYFLIKSLDPFGDNSSFPTPTPICDSSDLTPLQGVPSVARWLSHSALPDPPEGNQRHFATADFSLCPIIKTSMSQEHNVSEL